jgi:hypothetical protein
MAPTPSAFESLWAQIPHWFSVLEWSLLACVLLLCGSVVAVVATVLAHPLGPDEGGDNAAAPPPAAAARSPSRRQAAATD